MSTESPKPLSNNDDDKADAAQQLSQNSDDTALIQEPLPDKVDDEETLFRAIRSPRDWDKGREEFKRDSETGGIRFTQNAFADKKNEPSHDRKKIEPNAVKAKKSANDGIIALIAQQVRLRSIEAKGQAYELDIRPDPIEETDIIPANPAHSVVFATPDLADNKAMAKLRTCLSQIATENLREGGWTIVPFEADAIDLK